jgi:glutamate/aspartate transport system substrate-binding protein
MRSFIRASGHPDYFETFTENYMSLAHRVSTRLILSLSTLLALTASAFVAAGPTLDRIKQTGVVNIGYREAGLPFSYKNTDAAVPLGYGIDVCAVLVDAIKQQLKMRSVEVKYVPVVGATRIPAVVEGKIDFECANTTNTKSRRDQVAFGMPYYFAAAKLLVHADSGIKQLDDMAGKTVIVTKNSTGLLIAEARKKGRLPTLNILLADSSPEAVKALEDRKADAFVNDDILLYGLKSQSTQKLAIVGPGMSVEPLAIMFAKNDPELAALVDRELSNLYSSGKLRQMYKKWFQSPLPQRDFNLNVAPNPLTSDMFSRPNSYTVDWVVL